MLQEMDGADDVNDASGVPSFAGREELEAAAPVATSPAVDQAATAVTADQAARLFEKLASAVAQTKPRARFAGRQSRKGNKINAARIRDETEKRAIQNLRDDVLSQHRLRNSESGFRF